jgi:methylmalonyl-CoA/ethylmalonyl-CoA epimerase
MMRVDHIGWLVRDIEKAAREFEALGYVRRSEPCYDAGRDADIVFLVNGGYTVELVAPKSESSVVWNLLKKNGPGPYHICYETEDLEASEAHLARAGFVKTLAAEAAPALGGRRVAFFAGRGSGMIELLEKETG